MARTLLPSLVAYGPASGAVSQPVSLDSTNGNQIAIDTPNVPQNIDKYGLFLVVYNSAASTYNCIVRSGVLNGGTGPDLVTSVTNATIAIIGPLPVVRYGNPSINVGASNQALWIDFSNTLFTGTIMAVAGIMQLIPANTVVNAQMKAAPGSLLAAIVTTLGTGIHTFYDNAMPYAAGNTLGSFSASAAVGTMITGKPAANGIVSAGVASGPALTAFYA